MWEAIRRFFGIHDGDGTGNGPWVVIHRCTWAPELKKDHVIYDVIHASSLSQWRELGFSVVASGFTSEEDAKEARQRIKAGLAC